CIYGKISEMGPKMKTWNDEVLNNYGFGKYSMPAPKDLAYWQCPENHPFQKIAFNRWMSDKYADTRKQIYSALKQAAPNVKYVCSNFWFMRGFHPFDYSLFAKYTDWMSGDPYASPAELREGRGIYNHGFGTKLLKDLSGKPTITIVQAYHDAGYTPTPGDLREWVSQALKNGASRIEYFEQVERYNNPALYQEMFRLSKIFTSMNKVNVPQDADCAIFCSFDSEAALDANGDQIYTAYAILGEKVGSWFDFICDRQLERNELDLSKYKIVYLPLAKYIIPAVVDKLAGYVENGGMLVVGDPEAFSFNRDGSSLASYREKLCGVKFTGETFKASEIKIISKSGGKGAREGVKSQNSIWVKILHLLRGDSAVCASLSKLDNNTFPILKENSIYDKIHLAHSVAIEGATVIALFPNGEPALLENHFGRGKVYYFTANPFAPDVVLIDSKISEVFKAFQEEAKVKTERPVWQFLLPE
ncbi:MAG: beta-galactosidase trimerization domain-containing protein, partial [Kiritimatiellia bacterium]|nr:beta-galactosidase trimerization domain-containing protein [Kiritimatiellia bacterium]